MQYTEEAIKNRKDREKNIKKKFNIIVYILIVPMLIYNFSLIIQAILKPNETPAFLGIKMYVIVSGSMRPELEIGDIVIVKDLKKNEELKKDDIISFRQGQTVVTHRISEVINENGKIKYKTKGDNNNIEDITTITKDAIEGKVINKISSIGKIVLALRDKTLIIVIVLFYYIFLMHDQSVQKRKYIRKAKREEYEEMKKEEK